MTNEEKAREIALSIRFNVKGNEWIFTAIEEYCKSMAEWKDEQFKSVLRELSDWVESKMESAHTRRHTEELENGMSSKFFELGAEDGAFRQVRFWLNNNEFIKNLTK